MTLTFDKEFLSSLGIEEPHVVRVGYFYIDSDRSNNFIYSWTPSGSGSFKYEGSLSLDEVVQALNAKAKEIYTELQAGLLKGESSLEGINRMRNTYGLSLSEASNFIKGNTLGSCVLIKGGPLDGKCCVDSYYYFPHEIKDIIPLQVSEVSFTNEDTWEVHLEYTEENHQYISVLLESNDNEYTIASVYGGYDLQVKSNSKLCVFQGTYKECLKVEDLLRTAYQKGKAYIKGQVLDAVKSVS